MRTSQIMSTKATHRSTPWTRGLRAVAVAAAAATAVVLIAGPGAANGTVTCKSTEYACTVGGYSGSDPWGYSGSSSFGTNGTKHNCTSYAAFRLHQNGVTNPGNLGDAFNWAVNARAKGIPVDGTPRVGDIAQWNSGHVAYVDEVGSGYIVVTDDNYGLNYTTRKTITAGTSYPAWPDNFIHFTGTADEWFIKTKNTGSGKVEVHSATAGSRYTTGVSSTSRFSPADASNGWFQIVGNDLWFIKTKNTGSGKVEVHSATAGSRYTTGVSSTSRFSPADASNGWFQVGLK